MAFCAPSSSGVSSYEDVDQSEYKEYDFAKKKYGRDGKPVAIFANYFPISVKTKIIYHYNIDIQIHDFVNNDGDKNVPQRNRLQQQKRLYKNCSYLVFERLIKQETSLFSSEPIYDGRKNMYSKTRINMPERTLLVQVKQKIQEKKFPVTFDVTITTPRESHELDMTKLNDRNIKNAEKEIQALDIILAYGPKRYKLAVGSNLFLRKADLDQMEPNQRRRIRFDLGEMKEVSFGHYQSAKLTELGTQLNVDRVAVVFNKGGKLLNIIEQLCTEMRSGLQRKDGPPPRQVEITRDFKLNSNERFLLNQELKGLSFEVDHISYRPKSMIHCLTDKTVSEIFFDRRLKDSDQTKQTSVKEYFEDIYKDYLDRAGRGGLFGNLPCVQVGKNFPKYYPLEVIHISEDQYTMKKLKPKHQAVMTRTCGQQKPTERFQEGKVQASSLIGAQRGQTDYLNHFNIKIDANYTEVKGRILPTATLMCGNNRTNKPRDGQWRPDDGYIQPAKDVGEDWMVVNFTRDHNQQIRFAPKQDQINGFISTLLTCARNMGVNLRNPCKVIMDEEYGGRKDLDEAFADYIHDNSNLKLIILFIPSIDELYNNIKFLSELKFGVVTQCVSQDNNRKFSETQYVSNLMLKINAKLGGINYQLDRACKVGHLKKKTMIMGLDVTHPSRHDRLANSVASVVATYDSKMVNYYAKCVVQPSPRKEIVQLDDLTKDMLENFKLKTTFYPDYVLVYRDGVGDGQFNEVIDREINLMKKAFADLQINPKITFIVVQKRHHTRFLPVNERDRIPKSQNVMPGTVIDNTIVSNYYHDFFLCAHFGPLGTSRPSRYIVLHDDSEFSGDEIQLTTNVLSYLFPRCTKAVSVPPPVLYAHLSAKRARSYLFILDNNRGQVFGEQELTPAEILELNQRIEVKPSLRNILYFV